MESHPEAAHFHASKNSPFVASLTPFKVLQRIPAPSDGTMFNGFSTAIVRGGGFVPSGDLWQPMGLGIHDNISFNSDGKNQTSFTLTLTPLVPEPSSFVLGIIGGVVCYGFHLTRRRR
jgi:hypothetical protein